MTHRSFPPMPPLGVMDDIADYLVNPPTHAERFLLWLATHDHNLVDGPRFWRTAVLRECTPNPDDELDFVAFEAML